MIALFMLDTNAVSMFMHGRSAALDRQIAKHRKPDLSVSAITFGEIQYGLRHRPEARHLAATASALFEMVEILPWTVEIAATYGDMRAEMRRKGLSLQPLDMLIAAHALSVGAVLVTRDKAFQHAPGLTLADWSQP